MFGITRPGIEHPAPVPLANTLTIMPMGYIANLYPQFFFLIGWLPRQGE